MTSTGSAAFEKVLTAQEKRELKHSFFHHREVVGVDLANADLRGAHFEGVVLERCDLTGADLRGARFTLCELRDVVLAESILEDNRFDGTTFVDVVGLTAAHRRLIEECGGTFQPGHARRR